MAIIALIVAFALGFLAATFAIKRSDNGDLAESYHRGYDIGYSTAKDEAYSANVKRAHKAAATRRQRKAE